MSKKFEKRLTLEETTKFIIGEEKLPLMIKNDEKAEFKGKDIDQNVDDVDEVSEVSLLCNEAYECSKDEI